MYVIQCKAVAVCCMGSTSASRQSLWSQHLGYLPGMSASHSERQFLACVHTLTVQKLPSLDPMCLRLITRPHSALPAQKVLLAPRNSLTAHHLLLEVADTVFGKVTCNNTGGCITGSLLYHLTVASVWRIRSVVPPVPLAPGTLTSHGYDALSGKD